MVFIIFALSVLVFLLAWRSGHYQQKAQQQLYNAEARIAGLRLDLRRLKAPVGSPPGAGPYRTSSGLLHPKVRGISPCTLLCECGRTAFVVARYDQATVFDLPHHRLR